MQGGNLARCGGSYGVSPEHDRAGRGIQVGVEWVPIRGYEHACLRVAPIISAEPLRATPHRSETSTEDRAYDRRICNLCSSPSPDELSMISTWNLAFATSTQRLSGLILVNLSTLDSPPHRCPIQRNSHKKHKSPPFKFTCSESPHCLYHRRSIQGQQDPQIWISWGWIPLKKLFPNSSVNLAHFNFLKEVSVSQLHGSVFLTQIVLFHTKESNTIPRLCR